MSSASPALRASPHVEDDLARAWAGCIGAEAALASGPAASLNELLFTASVQAPAVPRRTSRTSSRVRKRAELARKPPWRAGWRQPRRRRRV